MAIRFTCTNAACGQSVKAPDSAAGRSAQCPYCRTLQKVPAPQPAHSASPAEPAAEAEPAPERSADAGAGGAGAMALDCLRAVAYGFSNLRAIGKLVLYSLFLGFLLTMARMLLWRMLWYTSVGPFVTAVLGAAVQIIVGGYFLRFYLDCAISSLEGVDQAPDVPAFELGELFRTGARGLLVFLEYALPVLTLPLLPVALLALAYTDDSRPFNPVAVARAALRKPGAVLVLCLILLLWLAALLAATYGLLVLVAALAAWVERQAFTVTTMLTAMGIAFVFVFGFAGVFHTLSVMVFRCLGMLGRHQPEILEALMK
jgi:hypothetical protein